MITRYSSAFVFTKHFIFYYQIHHGVSSEHAVRCVMQAMQSECSRLQLAGKACELLCHVKGSFAPLQFELECVSSAILGDSFHLETRSELQGARHVLRVQKCWFWDYFKRRDLPFLAPAFCMLDGAFTKEFEKSGRFRAQQLATMPKGAPACRFEFERMVIDKQDSPLPD